MEMGNVRDAQLMVTAGKTPFQFLNITFNQEASVGMNTWNTGSSIEFRNPTDEDLRKIIAACETGLNIDQDKKES